MTIMNIIVLIVIIVMLVIMVVREVVPVIIVVIELAFGETMGAGGGPSLRARGWERGLSGLLWRGSKPKLLESFAPPKKRSFVLWCVLLECSRRLLFWLPLPEKTRRDYRYSLHYLPPKDARIVSRAARLGGPRAARAAAVEAAEPPPGNIYLCWFQCRKSHLRLIGAESGRVT